MPYFIAMNPLFGQNIILSGQKRRATQKRLEIEQSIHKVYQEALHNKTAAIPLQEQQAWNKMFRTKHAAWWAENNQRKITESKASIAEQASRDAFLKDPNCKILEGVECAVFAKAMDHSFSRAWFRKGLLHRSDGPAIKTDLQEMWFLNGVVHRAEGRAICNHGETAYYQKGKIHNDDGPAQTLNRDGKLIYNYFIDSKLHRVDGPAVLEWNVAKRELMNQKWFLRGKLHRECGPAVIGEQVQFFLQGEELDYDEFLDKLCILEYS